MKIQSPKLVPSKASVLLRPDGQAPERAPSQQNYQVKRLSNLPDFNDSWSVPRWISKPRSAFACTTDLLSVAQDEGLLTSPIPSKLEGRVSTLGACFAALNVGAELVDGDFEGAVWDIGNGVVSLSTGAKLLGMPSVGVKAMHAGGVLLNTYLAIQQINAGERAEAGLRLTSAVGLAMSVSGSVVGGTVGPALGRYGLALRALVGLTGIARDLLDQDGFLERPDRFC